MEGGKKGCVVRPAGQAVSFRIQSTSAVGFVIDSTLATLPSITISNHVLSLTSLSSLLSLPNLQHYCRIQTMSSPLPPPKIDLLVHAPTPDSLFPVLSQLLEPSPPLKSLLAPQLHQQFSTNPPKSYSQLLDQAAQLVAAWDIEEQAAFLASHPRIGETQALSTFSSKEQAPESSGAAPTPGEVLKRLTVSLPVRQTNPSSTRPPRWVIVVCLLDLCAGRDSEELQVWRMPLHQRCSTPATASTAHPPHSTSRHHRWCSNRRVAFSASPSRLDPVITIKVVKCGA